MFNSIKSVIYPTDNLDRDKAYWTKVTGKQPYFDQPYYVGFDINGCELGLDPNASKQGVTYSIAYWHVADVKEAASKLIEDGAEAFKDIQDVGGGMMMQTFKDPSGNIFGIIDEH